MGKAASIPVVRMIKASGRLDRASGSLDAELAPAEARHNELTSPA